MYAIKAACKFLNICLNSLHNTSHLRLNLTRQNLGSKCKPKCINKEPYYVAIRKLKNVWECISDWVVYKIFKVWYMYMVTSHSIMTKAQTVKTTLYVTYIIHWYFYYSGTNPCISYEIKSTALYSLLRNL